MNHSEVYPVSTITRLTQALGESCKGRDRAERYITALTRDRDALRAQVEVLTRSLSAALTANRRTP